MRISMVGAGYVGLVSGACFSEFGINVTCVDIDRAKVERLKRGEIPIYEPGLSELISSNVKSDRLYFTTDLEDAVRGAQAVFIAVGTPSHRGDGHADLSYVYGAADRIVDALSTGYTVIITKSTVPVGTGDRLEAHLRRRRPDVDFDVVANPEFLREGSAINDFMRPDRHRQRTCPRHNAPTLSGFVSDRNANGVHLPTHGRAHQIRSKRLPRDQDHFHQRGGRLV